MKINQTKFYSMKSGKKKSDNKLVFIVGLVFLIGLFITFVMSNDKSEVKNPSNDNNQEINEAENNLTEVPTVETPDVEKEGILTKEEIEMVRTAVKNDVNGYFKLVNKDNILDENYKPDNIVIPDVEITKDRSNEQNFVRADIADDVEAFLEAAKEAGHEIFLSSGYRSYNLQSLFYNNDLQNNGGVETGYVAAPGTSEHQLGLAIDLTSHSVNLELTDEFENTPEGQWALENAYKYGFILRYKADKEEITGYKYEPWHYRYIGNKDISKLCHDKNLTLEELLEYVE